ncbi:PKD repeat protein, partial [Pelomonas saccharophila]
MRVLLNRLIAVLLSACIFSLGLAANDARATEFVATWRPISTTNAPQWREWSAMTWVDSLNQAVLWGGAGGGAYLNDVWTFDPLARSWTALDPNNSCAGNTSFNKPNGSDESGVVFDPINNYFWLWNGGSGYRCSSQQGFTRSAGAGTTGTALVDPTLPGTTNDFYKDWLVQNGGATAVVLSYDAALKTLTLDRDIGISAGAAYSIYADLGSGAWAYSLSTGQYTRLMERHWGYTGLAPTERHSPGFAGDGTNAYMFGGASNDNALYKLNFSAREFTLGIPAGQGTSPEPRGQIENQFVYDSFSRQFVLFGGVCFDRESVRCVNNAYLNDTWLYDPATNSWREVTGAVGPSARSYAQMYFDSKNGVVVLFGGVSPSGSALDDLWTFDTRTLLWTEVRVPATNPGNVSLALTTFAPSTGCGYSVYGHSRGSALFGIWELCLQPNTPPVAVISVPSANLQAGIFTTFSGAGSTDTEANIESYGWDFGDGTTAVGVSARKVYANAGTYTVQLTVTDSLGATATASQQVVVSQGAYPPPNANFEVQPSVGVAGAVAQFSAALSSAPGGSIVSYAWDFGDGTTGTGIGVAKTYQYIGTYKVALTVVDDHGLSSVKTALFSVGVPPGIPTNVALAANGGVASASSVYDINYPVKAINDGDRKGLNWGAGGGWNDATSGVYPDWVQIDFNGVQTVGEIDVFTLQDDRESPSAPTLGMTFGQYGIIKYDVQYWDGGAWVTVEGGNVTGNDKVWRQFVFAPVSTTRIRVLVAGAKYNFSRIVEVEAWTAGGTGNQAPVANISGPTSGQVGASLSFSGAGSTDAEGPIASYAWTFGDGTSASGVSVTKSYSAAGSYTVTLTVTDAGGLTNSKSQTVVITAPANQAPVANISGPTSGQVGASLSFSGAGSTDAEGPIASYAWTFGDGTSASGVSVTKSYSAAGSYTVTLTVTDAGGLSNSKTQT